MPNPKPRKSVQQASPTLPSELVERLQKNRIIPFVGAGVSRSVKRISDGKPLFPTWEELLLKAAQRLRDQKIQESVNMADAVESLLKCGKSEDFLLAAERASKGLGPIWHRFLEAQFNVESEAAAAESLELARLVWKLGSPLVITTNYDHVLRWACPNLKDLGVWNIEARANQGHFSPNPTVFGSV